MTDKITYLYVLLLLALFKPGLAATSERDKSHASGPPSSYRWTAEELPERDNGPKRVRVQGRAAAQFNSELRTKIDLSSQYAWRDLTGPATIRVVFQATRPPRGKTPLVSKWNMVDGGRSFELGLTNDGRLFLDVSGSGNWDSSGRELLGACQIRPEKAYCVAAIFDPGSRLSLFVNGHECGTLTWRVPRQLHANNTPLLLGAQPPGQRWADVAIVEFLADPRIMTPQEIKAWASSLGLTELTGLVPTPVRGDRMDLSMARRQIRDYCDTLQVSAKPYGVVRTRAVRDAPTTLYASCDVAWTRACMGEVLTTTLSAAQREQWIDHINSFARPDGTYENPNHSELHRNGMVVGALAVLGGKQEYPVSLYEEFDELREIAPWLEKIRWERQWGASHLFWGGMHCYSMSARCDRAWRERVFQWLDDNLNAQTGWWRKDVPQTARHIEVLGGAAHIWPIYQQHRQPFPFPRQVIDSILALQRPDGSWLGFGNYMELDALYGLAYMQSLVPDYRAADVAAAARRNGDLMQDNYRAFLSACPDSHTLLAVVGTLALLQELDRTRFVDEIRWSDIFSDRKFYETSRVETFTRSN